MKVCEDAYIDRNRQIREVWADASPGSGWGWYVEIMWIDHEGQVCTALKFDFKTLTFRRACVLAGWRVGDQVEELQEAESQVRVGP